MSRSRARTAAGVIPYGQHRPSVAPSAFVAPGAWVIGRVTLGQDASVWFGAVVRADMDPIVIGPGSIIEDNAVVHGRVTTGRGAIVAHGAVVQGTARSAIAPSSVQTRSRSMRRSAKARSSPSDPSSTLER